MRYEFFSSLNFGLGTDSDAYNKNMFIHSFFMEPMMWLFYENYFGMNMIKRSPLVGTLSLVTDYK